MNRQIKFRIWDKNKHLFVEDSCSFHCGSNWSICPFTGNVYNFVNFNGNEEDYYVKYENEKGQYTTQQWTGLFDKNGKEIYEGDIIIPYNKYGMKDGSKISIIFDTHRATFAMHFHHNETIHYMEAHYNESVPYGYIVIGNIFENPELVQETC